MSSDYIYSSEISSKTPGFIKKLARWLFWLFFIIPCLMLFLPWLQNISASGTLTAFNPADRRQTVEAPITGVISRWYVQEGTQVKMGDVLLDMTDVDPQFQNRLDEQLKASASKLKAKEDELNSYQLQLQSYITVRDSKVSAATYKRDMAQQKVLAATEAIHAAQANLETAELQLTRMQRLLADGLVSKREQEIAERDNIIAKRNLNSAKAQLDSAKSEERAANVEISQINADAQTAIEYASAQVNKIRGEIADSQNSILNAEVNIARQKAQRLLAPRDGTVFRLPVNSQSQIVSRGQPLLVIVPNNHEPAVELYVDGRDAPLVVKGSEVRLEFEGWPAAQVSGWPNIAIGTFVGKVAFVDTADDGQGHFRVMVVPDERKQKWPEDRLLRQGASVHAWILLEKVAVGYEIWRLLNGFPPRLPAMPESGKDRK